MPLTNAESSALSLINSDVFQDDTELSLSSQLDSNSTIVLSVTSKSGRHKRTSWIWQHDRNPLATYQQNGHLMWQCLYCIKQYRESGGTAALAKHLMDLHQVTDTQKQLQVKNMQMSISSALQNGLRNPYKRRRDADFDTPTFKQLLVRVIARCSLPFSIV
jgi:flagellar hook protein FlgE